MKNKIQLNLKAFVNWVKIKKFTTTTELLINNEVKYGPALTKVNESKIHISLYIYIHMCIINLSKLAINTNVHIYAYASYMHVYVCAINRSLNCVTSSSTKRAENII